MGKPNAEEFDLLVDDVKDGWAVCAKRADGKLGVVGFFGDRLIADAVVQAAAFETTVVPAVIVDGQLIASVYSSASHQVLRDQVVKLRGAQKLWRRYDSGGRRG